MSGYPGLTQIEELTLLKAMVDSLEQGLFIFRQDGICLSTFSSACLHLLQENPSGRHVGEVLNFASGQKSKFADWCKQLFSSSANLTELIESGPKTCVTREGNIADLAYRPIRDRSKKLVSILVTVSPPLDMGSPDLKGREGECSRSVPVFVLSEFAERMKLLAGDERRLLRLHSDFVNEILAVPIERIFARFNPLLCRFAEQTGKQISALRFIGDDVSILPERMHMLQGVLQHVFRNIVMHGIENAALRSESGKRPNAEIVVEFRHFAHHDGPYLRIIISDDGHGADIWQSTDRFEMPGFGFNMVTTEVEELGGRISIHSELGKGSAFVIELPIDLKDGVAQFSLPGSRLAAA